MTLGEKLKSCRTKKRLSQEKVAKLVGVSRQAVTKWENNQTVPNSNNLITLASIYGVSLDELVTEKQEEEKNENLMLHSNLILLAIILQAACINVAMQPSLVADIPSLRMFDLAIKFLPLLCVSIWMSLNLRYEKNPVQYKKNTKIELLYCLVQVAVLLFGHYSKLYFLGTLLLVVVASFYILVINPKYMNRQLARSGKHQK